MIDAAQLIIRSSCRPRMPKGRQSIIVKVGLGSIYAPAPSVRGGFASGPPDLTAPRMVEEGREPILYGQTQSIPDNGLTAGATNAIAASPTWSPCPIDARQGPPINSVAIRPVNSPKSFRPIGSASSFAFAGSRDFTIARSSAAAAVEPCWHPIPSQGADLSHHAQSARRRRRNAAARCSMCRLANAGLGRLSFPLGRVSGAPTRAIRSSGCPEMGPRRCATKGFAVSPWAQETATVLKRRSKPSPKSSSSSRGSRTSERRPNSWIICTGP